MAAALIAALFAMGVFAPTGVDAGVKKGDNAPTAKLVKVPRKSGRAVKPMIRETMPAHSCSR